MTSTLTYQQIQGASLHRSSFPDLMPLHNAQAQTNDKLMVTSMSEIADFSLHDQFTSRLLLYMRPSLCSRMKPSSTARDSF